MKDVQASRCTGVGTGGSKFSSTKFLVRPSEILMFGDEILILIAEKFQVCKKNN